MDYLLAFIIGSSIIITLITFLYLGRAYQKADRPKDIPYETVAIFVPVMYGLFNVINYILQVKYNQSPNISFIVGGTMGLIFSLIGRFGYDLPVRIFNFTKEREHYVHFIAPILYGLIFRFSLQPFNQRYLF